MAIEAERTAPSIRHLRLHGSCSTRVEGSRSSDPLNLRVFPTIFIAVNSRPPVKCLGDTGADVSCIDRAYADRLRLEIEPPAAGEFQHIQLANSECKTRRIGKTHPIQFVLFLLGDPEPDAHDGPIKPFSLSFQFEVMDNVDDGTPDAHQFIVGQDLISLLETEVTKQGKDFKRLFNWMRGGRPRPSAGDTASGDSRQQLSMAADDDAEAAKEFYRVAVLKAQEEANRPANDNAHERKPDPPEPPEPPEPDEAQMLREIVPRVDEDLTPQRGSLSTDEEKEAEYSKQRDRILEDEEIQQELQRNREIKGPCTYPASVVKLLIKKAFLDNWERLSRRQYNIPHAKRKFIAKQIADWLDRSKIELVKDGLYVINHPLLAVPKVSGGLVIPDIFRVCIDPRLFNTWLETDDKFEIPHIRRALEKFAGKTIFGELDLEEAFLQFELDPESRKYLTFTWEGKQYQFTCMPFGIKFMTSFCHRVICEIFAKEGLDFVDPYVDNLPFGSNSWEEHKQQLLKILRVCNKWNLRVKQTTGKPLKIGHSTMQCLGHIVNEKGVSIDPKKLDTIRDWPEPKTGSEMSSFLGFAGFIQQHVRHYSELAASLNEVKNEKEIVWSERMRRDFATLKRAIVNSPMLVYPDFERRFVIATDASNSGCGGVLYQPRDDSLEMTADGIVAICSHKWNDTQRNYSAYKKELFGLVYCLRKFNEYIWGRTDTVVFTDHKPLTYLFTQPELPAPLQQFIDHILDYTFELHYRPGLLNVLPDALSRMYERLYSNPTWGVPPNIRFADKLAVLESFKANAEEFDDKGRPRVRILQSGKRLRVATASAAAAPGEVAKAVDDHQVGDREEHGDELQDPSPDKRELKQMLLMEAERRGKRYVKDQAERLHLIQEQHELGHFGRDAIFNKLFDEIGVWWPGMRRLIQLEVAKCDACARFVIAKHGFKPAQFIAASGVWSHIQMDLAEFPESTDGHKYLLTVVDIFSGFVILRALKDKKAETVAQQLWAICALFGLPQIIQSDNGTEFKNEIISAFVKLVNSKRRLTAPYNPRCDGKVERTIGTVKTVIRKLLQGADRMWPRFIDFAQFSVNTKISTLTQSSPFALMFARRSHELMSTAELELEARPSQDQNGIESFESKELTLKQWRDFQDKLHLIVYPAINERIRRQKKKMIESIDRQQRQLQPNEFPDGSRVMILDPEPANKNEPKYVGPYQVVAKDKSGNLVLKHAHENGELLSRRVPPDQAKLAPEDAQAEPVYEVQEILDSKENDDGTTLYLTHWKGYARADATWEPAESFFDTKIIKDFRAKQKLKADQAKTGSAVQGESGRSARSNSKLHR